jgi:hypothetical protein
VAKPVIEKLTRELDLSLPDSIHAALEADAIAFDKTMQVIAREILQEWADRKHRAYTVYARRLLANGMQTELPGFETEEIGIARKARK